jgi:phage shock protein PspC (stress-responsive transcriptional regulator)
MSEGKKLFRSNADRKIFGVCGGIAEYLEVDSTIVRIIFLLLLLGMGTGLLAYLICALIMPEKK